MSWFCAAVAVLTAAGLFIAWRTDRLAAGTRDADPHAGEDFQARFEADERRGRHDAQ